MFAILHSLAMFVIDFFKSPRRLEAENLFLGEAFPQSGPAQRNPSHAADGHKEVVLAENASWLFRVTPYLIFAATWVAASLVPTFRTGLLFSWSADLYRVAGFASGYPQSHAGARRNLSDARRWIAQAASAPDWTMNAKTKRPL